MNQTSIPEELRALRQWVIWRYGGDHKPTKIPHTTLGYRASDTNPDHWSTFGNVLRALARPRFADGIGFVFAADDPYCGIDLDDIWRSDADEGEPWAAEILERFGDTYFEESPSGCGVKIWCCAQLPAHRGRTWEIGRGQIEIYDYGRFFAVTGTAAPSRVITDHQADIESLLNHLDGGRSPRPATITGKIPYGTQHNTLVSLAGTMRRRGMTAEAIEAALQIVNTQQCERPGPPENIHRIAMSTARWNP
jgi:primase-polymerase (primpol)-like protein